MTFRSVLLWSCLYIMFWDQTYFRQWTCSVKEPDWFCYQRWVVLSSYLSYHILWVSLSFLCLFWPEAPLSVIQAWKSFFGGCCSFLTKRTNIKKRWWAEWWRTLATGYTGCAWKTSQIKESSSSCVVLSCLLVLTHTYRSSDQILRDLHPPSSTTFCWYVGLPVT